MSGKLFTVALMILVSVGTLRASDKAPNQILGGKPAASSAGSARYYDRQGSFAGRSSFSNSSMRGD